MVNTFAPLRPPAYIPPLLRLLAALLAVFTLYRLFLLLMVAVNWGLNGAPLSDLAYALLIGLRFDTVVACYLLALPFLLLALLDLTGRSNPWAYRAVHVFLVVLALPCLFMLAADVPWFLQFFSRLNINALQWTDDGDYMYALVLQEPAFWLHLVPFGFAFALLLWLLKRASRKPDSATTVHAPRSNARFALSLLAFLITSSLLFLGMRGRTDEKSPIQVGTAYFCDDPFLNQLGLNPVFTFVSSATRRFGAPYTRVALMDGDEAVKRTAALLGAKPGYGSPIARPVVPTVPIDSANVVVILLESMSTYKLGDYNGPQGLMPFFSELRNRSLSFDNAYSAGIHTFNGIWSTLYSFPALYDQQPMQDWLGLHQEGLGNVLRAHGWSTVFFTTHDPEFDNMKGSLLAHGFDRVISEEDYPAEWVQSTNGVPDHRMFEFAIPELNALARKGPFLSVFMTASDHKPYILPPSLPFTPHSTAIQDRIVEYVDHALQEFFVRASKEPWYNNTVFVLLGDHGINMGHTYDMPLSFHHVPLIFHSPGQLLPPGHVGMPVGQIDVAPTILGALHVPWVNTTLGIDALRERRPFISFCADDRIGCIDSSHYFIHRADGHETLYAYAGLSTRDLQDSLPQKTAAMREHAFTMMQATQRLVELDQLDDSK